MNDVFPGNNIPLRLMPLMQRVTVTLVFMQLRLALLELMILQGLMNMVILLMILLISVILQLPFMTGLSLILKRQFIG